MQHHYIANAAVRSSSERTLPVIDPSDGQQYDTIQRGTPEDVDQAVQAARHCFEGVCGHRRSEGGGGGQQSYACKST